MADEKKRIKDEYMEKLWYLKEDSQDSMDSLKDILKGEFNEDVIKELISEGLVELAKNGETILLTSEGEASARSIIRSHRLAERMVHDVLGGDFESGACEFEHIITPELVDSICILLGHPKECRHGKVIPAGQCCKESRQAVESSVIPVVNMKIGQAARIAYVNCDSDQKLHKIDGLHIRPGAIIKLHQTYPTYVVECEGANIAMDDATAQNICVWKDSQKSGEAGDDENQEKRDKKKTGWVNKFRRSMKK